MKFKYRAVDSGGEEHSDQAEAVDRFALAADLRHRGLVAVNIVPVSGSNLGWGHSFGHRVKAREKIIFVSNLGTMIAAGLSLSRALGVMERQTANKYFKAVIGDLIKKIASGSSLTDALASYPNIFPRVLVAMVAAGEESGNLPESLSLVAEQMAKSHALVKKIQGAMIYPAIVVSLIVVVGVLMMIFLVPTLTSTFRELKVDLPLATRILIAVSDFIVLNLALVAIATLILIFGIAVFFRTETGGRLWNWFALRVPLFGGLVKQTNAAVVMRTISSLIKAGVRMSESLFITSQVTQNRYYRESLAVAVVQIEKGESLAKFFKDREKIFPILVGEMVEVGEETGQLSDMMLKGALFYEEEVDRAIKNISTLIEPLLMVVIGIAVGFFVVAMIAPIYSLSNII